MKQTILFFRQETPYTCGAASLRMALAFFGIKKSEQEIVTLLGTTKMRGTNNRDFSTAAESFRLNHVSMRNASIADLKEYQRKGFVIILGHLEPTKKTGHYVVLERIGRKYIHFLDPLVGRTSYLLSTFTGMWRNDPRYDNEYHWFFGIKK